MNVVTKYLTSRNTQSKLHAQIQHLAKTCWYRLGLRHFYLQTYLTNKASLRLVVRFYLNILFFRLSFNQREYARTVADSPPGTEPEYKSNFKSIVDYRKIKPIQGVSARHYEAGALRIGNRVNKDMTGVSICDASWRDTGSSEVVHDEHTYCLAVPRIPTESFALQIFQVFTCLLYVRALQRQGYEIECLLLDSPQDKLSELFTTCLPNCHFPKDKEGVSHFSRLLIITRTQLDDWRLVLHYCGLTDWFHQSMLSSFGIDRPAPTHRVKRITFIRRKRHISEGGKPCIDRVPENEEELIATLARHYPGIDVQAVYVENLPLREQLSLHTKSDIIISMHGAGLIAGSYFAPPNAGILELFPKYFRIPEAAQTCRAIAASRNLHYKCWLNHRSANEFGSDVAPGVTWSNRFYRNPVRYSSLTRVPPGAVIKRVNHLIRKIESAG